MRNKARLVGFGLLLGVMLSATILWATAAQIAPTRYEQTGGSLISGWHWLRTRGAKAVWEYTNVQTQLSGTRNNSYYILLNALVTNGVNGGSGYEAKARLIFESGTERANVSVNLRNPFRPQDPQNSSGLGYITYGFAKIPASIVNEFIATGNLKITYEWHGRDHVAVKQDSIAVSFSR